VTVARAPFVLNIADVLRQPGAQFPLDIKGSVPEAELSSARVPDDAIVALDATIEAQGKMVVVQGKVRAPWVGECRRCLEPASGDLEVDLREVFELEPADDGETYPIEGEQIDLGPVLRDVLALALPLAPLCREDCLGLCPGCGEKWADLAPDHGHETLDPRWAALKEHLPAD
jgi:uncharacterized protein